MSEPIPNAELMQALSPASCGQDPRYLDAFEAIQIEVDKLSGCDFKLVINRCQYVLSQCAKDMRVAAYLCFGLAHESGAIGLIQGISLLTNLIVEFNESIHPQRKMARVNALKWLNNPRLEAFVTQQSIKKEVKDELLQTIGQLNQVIASKLGNEFPVFTCLDSWLTSVKLESEKKNKVIQLINKIKSEKEETREIDNEKSALETVRQLIDYYQRENLWLTACVYTRVLRWGDFSLPAAVNNKTQLPMLRKEACAQLDKAVLSGSAQALLTCCESLFLESGGQVYLNLQYHAYQSALQLEHDGLSDLILKDALRLIERYPALLDYTFVDETPFANNECKHWLQLHQTLLSPGDEVMQEIVSDVRTTEVLLNLALSEIKKKSLNAILLALDGLELTSEIERVHRIHAKARAAVKYQKPELALTLYQQLNQSMQENKLAVWYKSSALLIWRDFIALLKSHGLNYFGKQQSEQLIQQVRGNMCLVDFNATHRLLEGVI